MVLLNCDVDVLGPLATVQAPVPTLGVFAPKVILPLAQIVVLLPALDVVGSALTVTDTLEDEAAQGELLIVHVNT